jgi:thioester reductase-like protein
MPTEDQIDQNCIFLTGTTGLLGSYILHNLLKRNEKIAVLARPGRKETAERRIAKILDHWKQATGKTVPMPVVFSGDLLQKGGLEDIQRRLADRCKSVIHCAASLTFYGSAGEEPWLSNIEGTKRMLDFCNKAKVGEMHYISTAYVAGSSKVFYEKDIDIGQELRNDYEKSKFEAEQLVRAADFLKQLTVYRPSIVVGDSVTGYTTTFHGFYAVLKLAHTMVCRLPLGSTSGRGLLSSLGMNGSERKNFVPVDWVTNVFDHIFSHPDLHGKTYHLTAPNPPLLTEFVDMVQDAVETWSTLANQHDPNRADENWFFKEYASEVQIYRAYLQDDPQFDSSNTQSAAPHLPCPIMNRDLMLFLARYAILSRFGRRKVKPGDLFPIKVDHADPQDVRSSVLAKTRV